MKQNRDSFIPGALIILAAISVVGFCVALAGTAKADDLSEHVVVHTKTIPVTLNPALEAYLRPGIELNDLPKEAEIYILCYDDGFSDSNGDEAFVEIINSLKTTFAIGVLDVIIAYAEHHCKVGEFKQLGMRGSYVPTTF